MCLDLANQPNIIPKILVIDDTQANLTSMKALLADIPATVITCLSGSEGLVESLQENIALVLLDVNMPDMHGFQLAELLKSTEQTRHIPIIFLTATRNDNHNKLLGYSSGAIDYMEKPIVNEILVCKVQLFLNMWRLRSNLEIEIAKRVKAEQEKLHITHHDGLTNLPNRLQLQSELQRIIAHSADSSLNFAVIFLNVDNFKCINDTYGHEAGDQLLKTLANRYKKLVRAYDIVARFGGDEFIILLFGSTDPLVLSNKLYELIQVTGERQEWAGKDLKVGVSIGVSIYPDHGVEAQSMINNSSSAMHIAKQAGRNTFRFYSAQINDQIKRRTELEQSLFSALENGEMEVYYQPIVSTQTTKVVAVEALLRWRHPVLGTVPPTEFIPIAESCGVIHELGLWVLQQAVDLIAVTGEIRVAVNVSPVQLSDGRLVNRLAKYIKAQELNPHMLELEITEGILLENSIDIEQQLTLMKKFGISLSIDDFGTGYSALGYLKRYKINKLKIDRSFISGIPQEHDSRTLTDAIIFMAHALEMEVVAEGVETEQQYEYLKTLACGYIQGYLFSKPLSYNELMIYLGEQRCRLGI